MSAPVPLELWPAMDSAVSMLWAEVSDLDRYVEDTWMFPGGRSKNDMRNDVANAKTGAQWFSEQAEKLKRGELQSSTALSDWREFPARSMEPLIQGIRGSADLSSVREFVDQVVVKSAGDAAALATGASLGFGSLAALGIGLYVAALFLRRA